MINRIIVVCRIEIQETLVNGTFNMMFLGHSISLGYRNVVNVVMRYLPLLCIFFWTSCFVYYPFYSIISLRYCFLHSTVVRLRP